MASICSDCVFLAMSGVTFFCNNPGNPNRFFTNPLFTASCPYHMDQQTAVTQLTHFFQGCNPTAQPSTAQEPDSTSDAIKEIKATLEQWVNGATSSSTYAPSIPKKRFPGVNEVWNDINIKKTIHEMIEKRKRLNEIYSFEKEESIHSFVKPEYVVTRHQDALEEEMKKIASSKTFRRIFTNDRDLLRKVKREENYYTKLAKAKKEDEQEAADCKRADEARYERYCRERQEALAEKNVLENEWQDYVELYKCCADWAELFKTCCSNLCKKVGVYTEIDIIRYMCFHTSFTDETPEGYLQRCYKAHIPLERKTEEEENWHYIIHD